MIRTRHLFALAASALVAHLSPLAAQPAGFPFLQRIADHLELTAEQRERIHAILEDARAQEEALPGMLPGKDASSTEARKTRREALRAETEGRIQAVLTPEQAAKAAEARDRLRAVRERQRERLEQAAEKLGLTEEQRLALRGTLEGQRHKLRLIREDPELAPEEARAKVEALHQETRELLRANLTPEQLEQFDRMRASRGRPAADEPGTE
jgi:Spy/CpxP family protein refolding chaperone